jgi:ribosome-associated heat shock protein Hsp15
MQKTPIDAKKTFPDTKVRLDKWLWAARFYKTRSLAKLAIENGKIYCDGQRVKPSKEISVGIRISIRQEQEEKILDVIALSDQRRGAPEAMLLYRETEESITERLKRSAERKAGLVSFIASDHRPNKKERRQIHQFQRINLSNQDE